MGEPVLPATRVVLVGESNPFGGDPYYALFPSPAGCAGDRLCRLVLGMRRHDYMHHFERINLCEGPWSLRKARARAEKLWGEERGRFILLGAKVSEAWQTPFTPYEVSDGGTVLVLPHPSGLNRMWNGPGAFAQAREAVRLFLIDTPIAALLGLGDSVPQP